MLDYITEALRWAAVTSDLGPAVRRTCPSRSLPRTGDLPCSIDREAIARMQRQPFSCFIPTKGVKIQRSKAASCSFLIAQPKSNSRQARKFTSAGLHGLSVEMRTFSLGRIHGIGR